MLSSSPESNTLLAVRRKATLWSLQSDTFARKATVSGRKATVSAPKATLSRTDPRASLSHVSTPLPIPCR